MNTDGARNPHAVLAARLSSAELAPPSRLRAQTDFTEDLKQISVPVLVVHGDADLLAFLRS